MGKARRRPPREGRPPRATGGGPGRPRTPPARPRPAEPPATAGRSRHRAATEETYHGLHACEALFARRPQDIVRVYLAERLRGRFARLLGWCAREKRGFQVVADENLRRISGATHHEGIAILARALPRRDLAGLVAAVADRTSAAVVYLDGVQNPHNLGSILRTAAHFGAAAVVGRSGELPPLSPAAVRVAEGAAEIVPVCDLADPAADLRRLVRDGFRVIVTTTRAGTPLAAADLAGKVVLVLGSEGSGVSPGIDRLAAARVSIPGTGAVESLNVAVACGVVLAETWRQAAGRSGRPGAEAAGGRGSARP